MSWINDSFDMGLSESISCISISSCHIAPPQTYKELLNYDLILLKMFF